MKLDDIKKADKKLFLIYLLVILGSSYHFKQSIALFRVNFDSTINNLEVEKTLNSSIKTLKKIVNIKTFVKGLNIEKIHGEVLVKRDFAEKILSDDWTFKKQDTITTYDKSFIKLTFGSKDQNRLTVGPNSILNIQDLFSQEVSRKSGSTFNLVRGIITSELSNLEKSEYKILTKLCSFGVRGTEFFVQTQAEGDNILVVKEGVVEVNHLRSSLLSLITKGSTVIYLKDGAVLPITNPTLLKKIQNNYKKSKATNSEYIEETIKSIFVNIDKVKNLLSIKDRVVDMESYYLKQVALNKAILKSFPKTIEKEIEIYRKKENSVNKDIDCLKTKKHCELENDSVLLQRGMVMTSGRKKLNKEAVDLLKKYLKNESKNISKYYKKINDLKLLIKNQNRWVKKIQEIKTILYPENGSIDTNLKNEILSLNKEINDKDLERFFEEAGWK